MKRITERYVIDAGVLQNTHKSFEEFLQAVTKLGKRAQEGVEALKHKNVVIKRVEYYPYDEDRYEYDSVLVVTYTRDETEQERSRRLSAKKGLKKDKSEVYAKKVLLNELRDIQRRAVVLGIDLKEELETKPKKRGGK